MSEKRRLQLFTVLFIVMIAKYVCTTTVQSSPLQQPTETAGLSPSMLKTVKSTSKSIGSKLTELFLHRFVPSNSFTLMITNNMIARRLIDPKIYLDNGKTITPPSFVIPAAEEPYDGTRHIALLANDPVGVLCYDNEPVQDRLPKAVSCVIFNAKKKQYALHAQREVITNRGMKELYDKFKAKSDSSVTLTKNKNGGFLLRDYKEFQMIAQITTGEWPRQLDFEVFDTVTRAQTIQKRIVTSIAGSMLLGSLSTLATFTFRRITADVGTTLSLENGSNENVPVVLVDPRWEQNGVKIQDIVPWRLAPKESCMINFVGPFGSGETFKRSVIALSFKVQGTNDRIILSIWWPKKLKILGNERNSYSVSWLRLPLSREQEYQTLGNSLRELVQKADDYSSNFQAPFVEVDDFQRYQIWKFPILNSASGKVDKFLNVLTNMGDARKNGMTVKIYGTVAPQNTNPSTTFPPKVYSGLPNEIPPI